ncbi:MAG TPA: DUF3775 domain-containing protein [Phenylobacterium sp.]|nr:DUF3775 domain-containing protein [Phenylobacterium sp.]
MPQDQPQLTLRPDTAFYILLKAREFHAKVEEVDPDEGSNPADDKNVDVLEFNPGDAVEEEVASAIGDLNEDELMDLIALVWVGRGDFTLDEWQEAREDARRIDRTQVAHYVLGLPMVSDALEDALSQLGYDLATYLDSGVAQPSSGSGIEVV